MDYAVVSVPAAALRRRARHQQEMVGQLLFGETVEIMKTKGNLWIKVRGLHDQYEGWMTNTLVTQVGEKAAKAASGFVATSMVNPITINGQRMNIPIGSSLPGFDQGKGKINKAEYSYDGNFINRKEMLPNASLTQQLTAQWLNAPYLWGGRTIFGVDCSGFVQVNYKMMGIDLPRDAWQQAQVGKTVNKLKGALCGDLAFFDDKEEIVHVGILLNSEQIIHASGKVRVDTIDKKGIIHSDTGKRTHVLQSIKRHW